jgi:hypothetical protein
VGWADLGDGVVAGGVVSVGGVMVVEAVKGMWVVSRSWSEIR